MRTATSTTVNPNSQQIFNGTPRPSSAVSATNGVAGKASQSPEVDAHKPRFASKPTVPRPGELISHYKDSRRAAVVAAICQRDEPAPIIDLLREISTDPSNPEAPSLAFDADTILYDQGHTAMHVAAGLERMVTIDADSSWCRHTPGQLLRRNAPHPRLSGNTQC